MMKVRTDHGVDHQPKIGVKKTRGKQKIEIKRIENKTRRQVTFSKRREGLFKKCSELGSLHGASVAAIAFSEAGRLFSYGNPTAQSVLERYIYDTNNKVEAGECRANWWDDVEIDGLELNELEAFKVSLEGLRKQVDSRIVEIKNAPIIGSDHGFGFDDFDNSSLFTDEDLGVVVQGGGGGGSSLDAQNGYGNRGLGCENFEYVNVNGGVNLGGNQDYSDFRSIINDPSLDADQQASSSRFGYCWLSDNYGMLSQVTC